MNDSGAGGGARHGGHPLAGGAGLGAGLPFSPHEARLLYASLLLMARHAHVAYAADGQPSASALQCSAIDLAERALAFSDLAEGERREVMAWLDTVFPLPA
jgi:hypothetical protein